MRCSQYSLTAPKTTGTLFPPFALTLSIVVITSRHYSPNVGVIPPNDPFRQLEIDPPVFASVDLTHPLAKHDQDQDGVSRLATLLLFVLLSAFGTGGWVRFAGHLSVFHAIAATLDGNRLGMVEKPVE